MTPEISVIVPTYNVEAYIHAALQSALSQEDVSLEVIVIDDGSTDRTVELVKNVDDPRVSLIVQPVNMGPGAARHRGIEAAKGRWIALLDGDDEFLPGRLSRLLKQAEHQDADMIVDNVMIYAEAEDREFPMFSEADFARLGRRLNLPDFIKGKVSVFKSYTLAHLKPMFCADFLKAGKIVYPQDLKVGEDYVFMADALAKGGICALDSVPGYRYRTRTGSLSFTMTASAIDKMLMVETSFLSGNRFDEAAKNALAKRKAGLKAYRAFLTAAEARARGEWQAFFAALFSMPTAIRFYLEPLWVAVRYDIEPFWIAACGLFSSKGLRQGA